MKKSQPFEAARFAELLCEWQKLKGRKNLPWFTDDPYRRWLSEIMLQQTQVSVVKDYFARFLEAFPTVEDLACADEEDVTITAGNEDIGLSNEFRFTLILGPAARYVFSPSFDAYAGIGFKIEEHIITVDDPSSAYKSTSYGTQLAVDCDMGVKFNMENNTSVRIGIYSTGCVSIWLFLP